MITPQSIIVSLEYAKLLKSAEWPQESTCFVWWSYNQETDWIVFERGTRNVDPSFCVAAPTCEDILRILPKTIEQFQGTTGRLYVNPYTNMYEIGYSPTWDNQMLVKTERTLADAAASMWIHLKKNNLFPEEK